MGDEANPLKLGELRGELVILDRSLAHMFEVETRTLNQAVSRNPGRFTEVYVFRPNKAELAALASQNVISKPTGRGGARTPPRVFTERGVVMAATSLRSAKAEAALHEIVETFIQARRISRESPAGSNMPAAPDISWVSSQASSNADKNAAALEQMFARVLEGAPGVEAQNQLVREASETLSDAVSSLRARLRRENLKNEKAVAEITKLLAEVEAQHASARREAARAALDEQELLERQLAIAIALDRYTRSGSPSEVFDLLQRGGKTA